MQQHNRLLKIECIARLLQVDADDVLYWCEGGEFVPPIVLPNGKRRWRPDHVMRWIEQRTPQAPATPEPEAAPEQAARPQTQLESEIREWIAEQKPGYTFTHDSASEGVTGKPFASGPFRAIIKALVNEGLIERLPNNAGFRLPAPSA
jgi:predicted DNA-binding transcriptional regulator AlpA